MCFFTKQTKKAVELEHRFKVTIEDPGLFKPSEMTSAFTFPKTPVITGDQPNSIRHFNWGLIPQWASDDSIKKFTLNAKIETLTEKPSFKDSVNRRCLVIANGFYEWQWIDPKGKSKQKYELSLNEDELFAFAGIWSSWEDLNSKEIRFTYSILTTAATKQMEKIHNSKKRMPVILTPNNENSWLKGAPLNDFTSVNTPLFAKKIGLPTGFTGQLDLF